MYVYIQGPRVSKVLFFTLLHKVLRKNDWLNIEENVLLLISLLFTFCRQMDEVDDSRHTREKGDVPEGVSV